MRRAAAVAMLALSGTAVAACSSGASSSASGGTTPSSSTAGSTGGSKVTLTYDIWDGNQLKGMQAVAKAFEAANPDIAVNVQLIPGQAYFTKLQTSIPSGTAPDVFWMSSIFFQQFAAGGALANLSGVGLDASAYPQQLVKGCQVNGTQYGVPKDFDTVGLWYNKALFKSAGVALPTASWTWADYENAAAKLTSKSTGVFGTAAELDGQQGFYNAVFQNGGYILGPDGKGTGWTQPKTVAALQFWDDLVAKGYSPGVAQMTDTAPLDMFLGGKVAMLWLGSWNVPAIATSAVKNDVNVVPLPTGTQRATVINGLCNVVYAKSQHPQQAAKFAAFLGSKQANEIQAQTGTVIPAYNGTQSAWVKAYPQYNLQAYLDELPYAQPYPVNANTYPWLMASATALGKAFAGAESVATAAQQSQAATDSALTPAG